MKQQKYSNRGKILFLYGFMVFIVTSLCIRLIDTQIVNGKLFADLADGNRMYIVSEPEERGVLLDRYLEPLVFNKPVYYKLDTSDTLYSEKQRISREEALQIMATDPDLIRVEHEREYRYPESLAHVIGYIGSVTADDLLADSSLHISDKIGKIGLEYKLQDFLKGENGFKKFEINAMGEKQHLVAEDLGIEGQSVPTTIDPYLSEVAYKAMGDKLGSVVILDGETGEVLSLVSTPGFDLRYFAESQGTTEGEVERIKKIQSFFSHPQKLFFNRAVSGAYPPGSVFKLITALSGLENQKITANTTVRDEGVLEVGEYSYANWYFTQYGRVEGDINLEKSIARSNDIFFYKVAEWVGPEKIKEMAELFGLGKKTGVQLQAESEGLIPDPEWKQATLGERWFLGNTYHFGIGQGDLLVSPIQIAQMVQGITNKGTLCAPTLVKDSFKLGYVSEDRCGEVGVLRENLDIVVKGMLDACSTGGTGFPFFSYNTKVRNPESNAYDEIDAGAVACKTGTSEFGAADSRGYRKTHGWFVASFGTKNLIDELKKQYSDEVGSEETDLVSSDEAELASESAVVVSSGENSATARSDKQSWRENVIKNGFPEKLVIVVLVESDEVNPYKEGSKDAGPVAKEIFDWMFSDVSGLVGQDLDAIPEYSRE